MFWVLIDTAVKGFCCEKRWTHMNKHTNMIRLWNVGIMVECLCVMEEEVSMSFNVTFYAKIIIHAPFCIKLFDCSELKGVEDNFSTYFDVSHVENIIHTSISKSIFWQKYHENWTNDKLPNVFGVHHRPKCMSLCKKDKIHVDRGLCHKFLPHTHKNTQALSIYCRSIQSIMSIIYLCMHSIIVSPFIVVQSHICMRNN